MAQINWAHAINLIILLAYAFAEYKLGKTSNGSLIGTIINAVKPQEKKDYGMNSELKAFITMFFSIGKITEMLIKDKGLNVEEEAPTLALFMSIPSTFSGAAKAFSEMKSLDSSGEADLISFLGTELGIVDPKTANIILKGVSFVLAGYNLEQAITSTFP